MYKFLAMRIHEGFLTWEEVKEKSFYNKVLAVSVHKNSPTAGIRKAPENPLFTRFSGVFYILRVANV